MNLEETIKQQTKIENQSKKIIEKLKKLSDRIDKLIDECKNITIKNKSK